MKQTINQLIKRKIYISNYLKIPSPPIRKLEKREYLTYNDFKNYDELTDFDKFSLNIGVE